MPKGSSWVPNAMLQQAEKNSPAPKHTGGVNIIRRGPKCQIWPRQPNRSSLPPWKGGEGHPFLQYMPKGSSWVPNAMLQQAEKNSPPPKHTGGVTSFEVAQSAKSGPGSQIGALCPLGKEVKAINSSSIYAQRLLMGPQCNVATGREEFTCTQTYWRME